MHKFSNAILDSSYGHIMEWNSCNAILDSSYGHIVEWNSCLPFSFPGQSKGTFNALVHCSLHVQFPFWLYLNSFYSSFCVLQSTCGNFLMSWFMMNVTSGLTAAGQAGEIMKFDYQRKVALLSKQKKRGGNSESLEKLKAAVSHLHTRYIVDMQSMDSTVAEINRLRDEQLYPKLVQLVNG